MSLIRDVNEMPLSGTHLIEASAGTGKTFTISRLFLRLIVEKGTPISKILVMTFTRKATAELKERLQDVLFRAKKALQDKSFDNDPQIAFLKNEDRQTALTRVESALSDFDEANVFTIHAFCQRVLDDAAFDSATDTGIELDPSQPIYDQTKALFFKRYVPDDSPEMAALVNLGLFTADPWKTIASVAMHEPDAQFDAVNPDSEDDEALKAGLTMELFREKYPELHDEVCALCRKSDYDGITHRLSQMLRNDTAGVFARQLGSRYDAVLVDEFQDTDAEQYGIFRKAFIENARQSSFLCFVGDPKQSIYRFRHADVFVYAKAKNEIEPRNRWTISKNYRSTPELLNVVNHIFGLPNVFRTKNFTYENVESGGSKPGLMQEDKRVPPVTLYEAGEKKDSANFSKNYERNLARVVTKRIVEFLDSDNGYRLEDRPVRASDIAILVYTNNQIDLIRSELAENGIAANAKTQHSIFDTDEYAQIKMLLEGIIHCDNLQYVKGALTTDFFLASGAASPIQEQALDEVLTAFASYKDIWLKQGAGYLLEYLMREKHLRRYLFALPEGQRSVVNWEHLTEVLYELDEKHGSPEALLSQLVALSQVKTRDAEADTAELLRMQQDDNVVTILTYHASKGLQFPIVFLPYFCDVFQKERKLQKAAIHSYYDKDGFKHYFPGFLRNDNSTGPSLEMAAESVRVTYVAMTRAISHLEVIDMQDQPEKSFGLALTISEKNVWDSLENKDASLINRVKIEDMFLKTSQPLKVTRDRLSAREGAKPIYPDWAETSYSALVRKTDATAEEAAEAVRRDDANLVDSDIRETNETLKELEELGLTRDDIVFFPRGASAGEALHAVLEKIDLTQPQSWEKVAQRALEVYYPKDSVQRFLPGVLSFLERLAQTPMVGKTTLQGVPFSETIREMPFYLRADQTGIGNKLSDAMRQTGKKGFDITPLAAGAQVAGYIKGFIDFIFRIEGRYYIIDWKSNFLNTARVYQTADDFFAEAYGRDSMAQAMEHHAYTLQYAIYTVALVRYLRARLGESFDYERHVGGIRYVFLRGVRSGLDGVGVWEDRLDENFVKQLDRLFGGSHGARTLFA